MPFYKSQLLSSWTPQLMSTTYFPPPPKIPPQVLESLKVNEFVKHATLPKELRGRRNIVPAAPPKKDHARFRSGKSRNVDVSLSSVSYVNAELDMHKSHFSPNRRLQLQNLTQTKFPESTV